MNSVELLKTSTYQRKDGGEGAILLCYLAEFGQPYQIFTTKESRDLLVSKVKETNSTEISNFLSLKYDRDKNRLYYAIDVNKLS